MMQAKRLIEVNFDPDFRCENGETLLHMACKSSDSPRTIRLFLDSLASPSLLDKHQRSPLYYAITSTGNRSLEIVQLLLDYDAHVVFQDKNGGVQNMLIIALLHGNIGAAKVIMDSKACVIREDLESRRISYWDIMSMILKGHTNSVKFLKDTLQLSYLNVLLLAEETIALSDILGNNRDALKYNCDRSEKIDVTVLQLAALCGNVEMVHFLQGCGVDIAEANSNGETSVDLVRAYCNVSNQKVKDMLAFLEQADIEKDSLDGSSLYLNGQTEPAMNLPGKRLINVTQSLQEIRTLRGSSEIIVGRTNTNKAPRLVANSNGPKSPFAVKPNMHSNVRQSSIPEIKSSMIWVEVRDSLENGANPNHLTDQSNTPLHVFCEQGKSVKIVELLLQHGANPNILNKAGQTPLTNTVLSRGPRVREIISVLLEYGARIVLENQDISTQFKNPFRIAIENESTDIASLLYTYSPEVLKSELESKPLTLEYVNGLVANSNIAMLELLAKDMCISYMKQYLETNVPYHIPATLTEDIPLATLLEEPGNQQQGRNTVSFAQDLLCPGSSLHLAALQCNVPLLKCLVGTYSGWVSHSFENRLPYRATSTTLRLFNNIFWLPST